MPPTLAELDVEEMEWYLLDITLHCTMLHDSVLRQLCCHSGSQDWLFGTIGTYILHPCFGMFILGRCMMGSCNVHMPIYGAMWHDSRMHTHLALGRL